jgi:hypothetical protein
MGLREDATTPSGEKFSRSGELVLRMSLIQWSLALTLVYYITLVSYCKVE